MKLEDIETMWAEDAQIDKDNLDREALHIAHLHQKYYGILLHENRVLNKKKEDLKKLRLDKQEFFLLGPTKETMEKGWQIPASGKVLRSDVGNYIDADKDVSDLNLAITFQMDKIKYLESIISMITYRNHALRTAVDFMKFRAGVG